MEEELCECPVCNKQVKRDEMTWTNDCHGIVFRKVCFNCWDYIMSTKGYDGEYYSDADENIYEDY